MASEQTCCKDYLNLKPEEASCFDFIRILLCSNTSKLNNRDFFETHLEGDKIEGFGPRWIIFISVLLQKIFLYLKKPVAAIGSTVEIWLNYPTFNGGHRRLFSNLMAGRLVKPDKSSAKFTSIAGYMDSRIELDTEIRNGDLKYNASLAMMASKLSYENEASTRDVVTNHWQMEFLEFNNCWNDFEELNTTQAFMFQDKTANPNLIVVAFRGTETFDTDDWRTDVDLSWYEFQGIGKVHSGFMKALGLQKSNLWPKEIPLVTKKMFAYYAIREKLRTLLRDNGDAKFILTGHSLGAALAILFVGILAIHEEENLLKKLEGVYTFGQPRVGDEQFGEYMKQKMKLHDVKYFRYVYSNDMVPRLPYDDRTFLFKHFGPCLYFNSFYKGWVLGEEPNKNYFSLLYVVPKIFISVLELIRSFILPWRKGKEYNEGWLMKTIRVVFLLTPGLTNHFLVDYVNVTRLGELPSPTYSHGPNQNPKQA